MTREVHVTVFDLIRAFGNFEKQSNYTALFLGARVSNQLGFCELLACSPRSTKPLKNLIVSWLSSNFHILLAC